MKAKWKKFDDLRSGMSQERREKNQAWAIYELQSIPSYDVVACPEHGSPSDAIRTTDGLVCLQCEMSRG